ncbi:hypothetical protein GG851_18460 [Bordetella petrii]|nr:hypothetical protein [Bordetella petrii]
MIDARFVWDTAVLNEVLCERQVELRPDEIERFRSLMGYPPSPPGTVAVAPTSMGLTYGLGLGWEHAVFPPGAVRMGDEDRFGVPAYAGDTLTTRLRIVDRFERKGRRFLKYEMVTRNQRGELVCEVIFVAIVP